jgi:hypothetical protein
VAVVWLVATPLPPPGPHTLINKETHMTNLNSRQFVLTLLDQLDMNIMRLKAEMQEMSLTQIAEEMTVNVTLCNASVKACLKAANS